MKKPLLILTSILLIAWSATAQNGPKWLKINPVTPLTAASFAHPSATDHAATETRKPAAELDLKELKAWPEIPALQNTSGSGMYSTSFDLPSNWTKAHGARLSLGEVFDTFTLVVNNTPVAIDQISAEGDIGAYLKAGRNTIVVRVATTLNNRLVKLDDDVAKRGITQPYGLVGPVVLTPYAQATVWQKTGK